MTTYQNPTFQITLVGYDPSTSETDDLVKWIKAPNLGVVKRFLTARKLDDIVRDIDPDPIQGGKLGLEEIDGVDVHLDQSGWPNWSPQDKWRRQVAEVKAKVAR